MILEVKRKQFLEKETIGEMWVNGQYYCDTLEDAFRETDACVCKWKVQDKTAIPMGWYEVVINYSNRFKKNMPLLEHVAGFTGIRIHGGNCHEDTSGCILVGVFDGHNKLRFGSKVFSDNLCIMIKTAIDNSERVLICVK